MNLLAKEPLAVEEEEIPTREKSAAIFSKFFLYGVRDELKGSLIQ